MEDDFTSTVEGAAAFERDRAERAGELEERDAADRDHDSRIDIAGAYVPPEPWLGSEREEGERA